MAHDATDDDSQAITMQTAKWLPLRLLQTTMDPCRPRPTEAMAMALADLVLLHVLWVCARMCNVEGQGRVFVLCYKRCRKFG